MTKQELQSISPASRPEPPPMSQGLHTALRIARNALVGERELLPEALPQMARIGLKNRLADLRMGLAPAERSRIREILATLADMPKQVENDPTKQRYSLERDVVDLSEFPEWALASAARAYRKGEVGDGRWQPTAGELAILAREKVQRFAEEAAQIDAVLRAPVAMPHKPIDPERRKELANLVRGAAGLDPE